MTYAYAFLVWCAAVALWPTPAEIARWRARQRRPLAPVASHLLYMPGGCLAEPLSAASRRGGVATMATANDPTTTKGTR